AATLSAAWAFPDGRAWVTRIGDCRAYHYHQGGLRRVAEDQTYASLPAEVRPAHMPLDNPSNMVGNGTMGRADFFALSLVPGDILLLCSDGLHHFVNDADIATQCALAGGDTLVRALIALALAAGGDDDIAVLVLTRRVMALP
ncbi:PP2C family protein-serine/threonine phosphatase, partial [Massilia glaciei]